MELVVAARGSKLSLKQVEIAMQHLSSRIQGLKYRVLVVKTRGDRIRDKPLYSIGGKGLFEKEVNMAVLDGRADIAVHSMKDLPSEISPELEIAYIPPRDSPREALVPKNTASIEPGTRELGALVDGETIGTSSVRRAALLHYYSKTARVKPIRGNLDTRLKKLDRGDYDYIVVAEAGLQRLGVERPYIPLNPKTFPPAPGQGFIAVVAPRDSLLARAFSKLVDPVTRATATAERAFLATARAGCHVPLGGVALAQGTGLLRFIGVVLSPDGSKAVWIDLKKDLERAEELGREAGEIAYSVYDKILS